MPSGSTRFPKVEILELRDDFIKFVLYETDTSVANSVRRVMMSEIPTLAIDLVNIEINTSVLTDEFLAHRLGMVPLTFDGTQEDFKKRFNYSEDCDCDENCPHCSVEFECSAVADKEVLTITSKDLTTQDLHVRVVDFSSLEEKQNTQDEGIILLKLGSGQQIKFTATAKLGIAKEHAKWAPVAAVSYMFEPIITLNPAVMDTLTSDQKQQFIKSCPTQVYEYDDSYETITVMDKMKCMFCDECVKLSDSFKENPEDDGLATVMMQEDRFTFSVETNGALKPEDVVLRAIEIVKDKLSDLKHQCLELKQHEQSALAP